MNIPKTDTPKTEAATCNREDCDLFSAWDSWSAGDLEREIKSRMTYFYKQTDGTMAFPNSSEGDLLKIVHAFLKQNKGKDIKLLLIEAADSVKASTNEEGISDGRREYRKNLESRLRSIASDKKI